MNLTAVDEISQLADAIAKLREIHHHTLRLAEYKTIWLKKADAHLDEYNEMFEFIVKWTDRARSLVKANIIWNSSSHLQEQIRMYQVNHNTQNTQIA
uniref:Uncharacterized protein n=1 Tax=Sinocyclocheilus rhinocerous TaxID=307959 RepID=A0A673LCG7_9TELE